jgi:Ethanolamine utilization protein EutJ (predicted chaperonin)
MRPDEKRRKAETEALARLAISSDWQILKPILGRLADTERRHLVQADFQNLLMVGRAQGRAYAYESLAAMVEKAPDRASKYLKEE